jgi:hypothetical protein
MPKIRWWLLPLLVAACGRGDAPPSGDRSETPAVTTASSARLGPFAPTGVKACDAYFAAVAGCQEAADADLLASLRESVTGYQRQLAQAKSAVAKGAIGVGCSAAHDALQDETACNTP